MSIPLRNAIKRALVSGLAQAWRQLSAAHAHEQLYAFGLYTTDLAEYFCVTASSEAGLDAVTARNIARAPGRDVERERASLRWSPCDSPLHGEADSCLDEASALRNTGPDPYDDSPESDAFVQMMLEVAVEALRELDAAGTFSADRQMLTLGVWKGDQSDEDRKRFVRLLNDSSVADRFEAELDSANDAFGMFADG